MAEISSSKQVDVSPNESTETKLAQYDTVPLDCEICQHIMRGFYTPSTESFNIDLGSADNVYSKSCPAHTPLLTDLKANFEGTENPFTAAFRKKAGSEELITLHE